MENPEPLPSSPPVKTRNPTGLPHAWKCFWRNYLRINRPASRAEFWWIAGIGLVVELVAIFVLMNGWALAFFGAMGGSGEALVVGLALLAFAALCQLFLLVLTPGSVTLIARRSVDVGLGWWAGLALAGIFFLLPLATAVFASGGIAIVVVLGWVASAVALLVVGLLPSRRR